jgi:hyperosmotically inducible protein
MADFTKGEKVMKSSYYLLSLAIIAITAGCNQSSDSGKGASGDNQSYVSDSSRASAPSDTTSRTNRADNTGVNTRDRSDETLTPGDQGGNSSDREVTRRIRKALTSDQQLSTDAKNIKIITTDGKVTLRGPVNSEQEKSTIDSLAKQNGATSVDDQLEVAAKHQ